MLGSFIAVLLLLLLFTTGSATTAAALVQCWSAFFSVRIHYGICSLQLSCNHPFTYRSSQDEDKRKLQSVSLEHGCAQSPVLQLACRGREGREGGGREGEGRVGRGLYIGTCTCTDMYSRYALLAFLWGVVHVKFPCMCLMCTITCSTHHRQLGYVHVRTCSTCIMHKCLIQLSLSSWICVQSIIQSLYLKWSPLCVCVCVTAYLPVQVALTVFWLGSRVAELPDYSGPLLSTPDLDSTTTKVRTCTCMCMLIVTVSTCTWGVHVYCNAATQLCLLPNPLPFWPPYHDFLSAVSRTYSRLKHFVELILRVCTL